MGEFRLLATTSPDHAVLQLFVDPVASRVVYKNGFELQHV